VDELERLAEAYEEFTGLLDRYEEPATGDGDFQTFIEFQGKIETAVERLPDDLLLRETFEECDDYLQQRRLTESDFAHVRDQLAPVADLVDRLSDRRAARQRYREARDRVDRRRRELGEEIAHLERLQHLGEADLEAPTERLREPIEQYNDAVAAAVATFLAEAPAREVVSVLERTANFPLVDYRPPPDDLAAFVRADAVGTEPVEDLLAYADYSRSKLAHYVDDPDALKRAVASQQTYLRRLDAEPLTVSWPPPPAGELVMRVREYRAVLNRFAPDVVEELLAVRKLPVETEYERLRTSAVARAELDAEERERLQSGAVAEDLARAREQRERLEQALAEFPSR
jgi:hypothetical protein